MKRLLVYVGLLALVAAAAGYVMFARVREPYRGYENVEQFVEIPQRAGSRAIGERLVTAGVVRDQWTFRLALWMTGEGRHLQAGEYRFDRAMTPVEVITKIARGDVFAITVTFPEGLTIADMGKIFESHGLGPSAAFIEAARDASAIHALDPAAKDLEGYLFPETYQLPRRTEASKLVRQMVSRFEQVFTPELRLAAAARNLSLRQAVTLASIVEKETARPEERPVIAAVYENRMRIGMPLQCDPTVIYALVRARKYDGNLRREDLMFDSPYNTYRYPGLPPGPIASPGRASLAAAVHPADADYLYFVSRNDGFHEFARTLEEHNRNVQRYQVQYFRERSADKASMAGKPGTPATLRTPRSAEKPAKAGRARR